VPPAQMKTFTELANVDEFWDWVSLVLIPKFYQLSWENGDNMKPSETNTWMRKIRPIIGMRLVQRRAMIGSETRDRIGGGCWSGLEGEMRKFAPDCYDALQYNLDGTSAFGFEDRSAFGTFTNSTKYKFESFKSGENSLTHPNEDGFFVFFPLGGASAKEDALRILQQLKKDRWVDRSTQWLKIEMLVVNADERVLFMGRFMLHITNIGLVIPVSVFDTFQVLCLCVCVCFVVFHNAHHKQSILFSQRIACCCRAAVPQSACLCAHSKRDFPSVRFLNYFAGFNLACL
jgi:hypothetical protein